MAPGSSTARRRQGRKKANRNPSSTPHTSPAQSDNSPSSPRPANELHHAPLSFTTVAFRNGDFITLPDISSLVMAQQADPMPQDVAQFKDFTGCADDRLIIAYLRRADFNVPAAVENFFERNGAELNTYDHGDFGGPGGNVQKEFTIVPHDNIPPTRPPSRSSMHAQMDLQESGVIAATGFGPATRAHYDETRWAMTVADAGANQSTADINVLNRVRHPGLPVFLRATQQDRLASFLSILGHIPLARRVLLELGEPLADYGPTGEWWSGTSIAQSEPAEPDIAQFVHEMHRLVAFMSLSTRLYGSVGPLAELVPGVIPEMTLGNDIGHFLAALNHVAKSTPGGERAAELMQGSMTRDSKASCTAFNSLILTVDASTGRTDMYDAIDEMLWGGNQDDENAPDLFLVQLPPILVLRATRPVDQSAHLDLEVASIIYMDRYTEQNKGLMKNMRREMGEIRLLAQSLKEKDDKIRWGNLKGQKRPSQDLMRESIGILRSDAARKTASGSAAEKADGEKSANVADRLEVLMTNLKLEMAEFEARMATAERMMAELSMLLKPQSDGSAGGLHLRYGLCGVVPNAHSVAVHCPLSSSLAEGEEPLSSTREWVWQYVEFNGLAVTTETMSEDEVLKLALSTRDVILVYANEQAVEEHELHIPDALKHFVNQDNHAFENEQAEYRHQWQQSAFDPDSDDETGLPPSYEASGAVYGNNHELVDVKVSGGDTVDMVLEDSDVAAGVTEVSGLTRSVMTDSTASVQTVIPADRSTATTSGFASEEGASLRQRTADAAREALRGAPQQQQQRAQGEAGADVDMLDGGVVLPPVRETGARLVPPPLPPRDGQTAGQQMAGQAVGQTGQAVKGPADGKEGKKGRTQWMKNKLLKKNS